MPAANAVREGVGLLLGIKVGGDDEGPLFSSNPGAKFIKDTGDAPAAYTGGAVGGTAWLFARPAWEGALACLFIDEAGQVPLATRGLAFILDRNRINFAVSHAQCLAVVVADPRTASAAAGITQSSICLAALDALKSATPRLASDPRHRG